MKTWPTDFGTPKLIFIMRIPEKTLRNYKVFKCSILSVVIPLVLIFWKEADAVVSSVQGKICIWIAFWGTYSNRCFESKIWIPIFQKEEFLQLFSFPNRLWWLILDSVFKSHLAAHPMNYLISGIFLIILNKCAVITKVVVIFYGTEYCNAFDNYSVRPLICLLKTNGNMANIPGRTSTSTEPGWEWEDEDESCSCEVNCFPTSRNLFDDPLQCQPCGTTCAVSLNVSPRCSCAVLGPSTSNNGPRCRCSVTCAQNPVASEDPFCIFNVTQIRRVQDINRPYSCDCDQSRAAQNNEFPYFNCVCQPAA